MLKSWEFPPLFIQRRHRRDDRGRRRRVVDLVVRRDPGHRQGQRRDRRGRGRLHEGVAGRLRAGKRQAGDRNGLARPDVLIGKRADRGRRDQSHLVAALHAVKCASAMFKVAEVVWS